MFRYMRMKNANITYHGCPCVLLRVISFHRIERTLTIRASNGVQIPIEDGNGHAQASGHHGGYFGPLVFFGIESKNRKKKKLYLSITLTIKSQNIGASSKFFCKKIFNFDIMDIPMTI